MIDNIDIIIIKNNNMTLKRFVIRKSLIGKNEVITFTNKKGETVKYNNNNMID